MGVREKAKYFLEKVWAVKFDILVQAFNYFRPLNVRFFGRQTTIATKVFRTNPRLFRPEDLSDKTVQGPYPGWGRYKMPNETCPSHDFFDIVVESSRLVII